MSVRIGAVSYLNTKPLIFGLQQRLPGCELRLDLPSRLADQLSRGDLDVALIPSVEFLRARDLAIVSDACIACRGPVRSVRLLFRCRPEAVKTLALDEGSRTSAALAQVLLARRYGVKPALRPLKIDASLDDVVTDALLVIGDRAMEIDTSRYLSSWDLGEEWMRETSLPFVFAMWVSAGAGLPAAVVDALQSSRDLGLENIEEIVALESPRYGLSAADCRRYFLEQLYFTLGGRELEGLELFRQWALQQQLLPNRCQQLSLEPT